MTDFVNDDDLTAFLEGTLSDAEAERIDALAASSPQMAARLSALEATLFGQSGLAMAGAFEPLLAEAPMAALQAGLAAIPARSQALAQDTRIGRRPPNWPLRLAALAACLMLFMAGGVADRALVGLSTPAQPAASETALSEDAEWRQAVAGYVAMYTPETLAAVSSDPSRSVAAVSTALNLPLTPARLTLSGLTLKAAQVLGYDGKALGQIAYLDPQSGPVALCIIQSGAAAAGQAVERRHGLSIVYWSQGGRSFMVIGSAPVDRLKTLATQAAEQIS